MICYKDMTFCPRKDCKKFGPCPRSATDEVKADAAKVNMNMSMCYFEECYEPKDNRQEG